MTDDNKIRERWNKIWLLFGIIILLAGCKPKEKITKKEISQTLEIDELERKIEERKKNYITLKLKKIEIDYTINDYKENLKGNIGIIKDSIIIISIVPALGYEISRIWCSKDSIKIINRPEKEIMEGKLTSFLEKYRITAGFEEIQSMLTNEVFYYKGKTEDDSIDIKKILDKNQYIYIQELVKNEIPVVNQSYYWDIENYNLNEILISDYERRIRINIQYSEFNEFDMRVFPQRIQVGIWEINDVIEINLNIGQIEYDEDMNINMRIPGNYKKIDI